MPTPRSRSKRISNVKSPGTQSNIQQDKEMLSNQNTVEEEEKEEEGEEERLLDNRKNRTSRLPNTTYVNMRVSSPGPIHFVQNGGSIHANLLQLGMSSVPVSLPLPSVPQPANENVQSHNQQANRQKRPRASTRAADTDSSDDDDDNGGQGEPDEDEDEGDAGTISGKKVKRQRSDDTAIKRKFDALVKTMVDERNKQTSSRNSHGVLSASEIHAREKAVHEQVSHLSSSDGEAENSDDDDHDLTRSREEIVRDKNLLHKSGSMAASTRRQYLTSMEAFKTFCDEVYALDGHSRYEVYEDKILVYFEDVLFQRTIDKAFKGLKDLARNNCAVSFKNNKVVPMDADDETVREFLGVHYPEGTGPQKKKRKGPLREVFKAPISMSLISQAKNAILYIGSRQAERKRNPNEKANEFGRMIADAINNHFKNVVHSSDLSPIDHGVGCAIRDSYSVKEHRRALLFCWVQKEAALSPYAREHFALSIRHSMLLRDEDLRRLKFSSMFAMTLPRQPGEVQKAISLLLYMKMGKTNTTGRKEYACAIRHKDVFRCSLGALGFYLFDRFHNKSEPYPDFSGPSWQNIRAIKSGDDRTTDINKTGTHEITQKVFRCMDITTSYVTHSGRHSGSVEAQRLSVPEEDIRRAGRWVQGTSKMHQYYLSSLPIPFARAVAGFRNQPFHLKRNEVTPSVSLQEQIFPFIESAYDYQGEKAIERWKLECADEMNETGDDDTDENLAKELQDLKDRWLNITVAQRGKTATTTPGIAKKNFLKLLLRLRRVILQDAVAYLESDLTGPILDNEIFTNPEFQTFRIQLGQRLSMGDQTLPADIPAGLLDTLQGNRRQLQTMQQDTQREIAELKQQVQSLVQTLLSIAPQGILAQYRSVQQPAGGNRHGSAIPRDQQHNLHNIGIITPLLNTAALQPTRTPAPEQSTRERFAFIPNNVLDKKMMATGVWSSYRSYLDFREKRWRRGMKAFEDKTRRAADDYRWIAKEIIFRVKAEISSGVIKEDATAKVLQQLDAEYSTRTALMWGGHKEKGWTAVALKRYCEERVLQRQVDTKKEAPEPKLEDF